VVKPRPADREFLKFVWATSGVLPVKSRIQTRNSAPGNPS
jgi:hypothetical protein